MTPKEKAFDLVYKFSKAEDEDGFMNRNTFRHKQCALIAVDELINSTQYKCHLDKAFNEIETTEYWLEVKQEIEKI